METSEDGYVVVAAWLTVVGWVGGFRFWGKPWVEGWFLVSGKGCARRERVTTR